MEKKVLKIKQAFEHAEAHGTLTMTRRDVAVEIWGEKQQRTLSANLKNLMEGVTNPTPAVIEVVCKATGVSPNWLFEWDDFA